MTNEIYFELWYVQGGTEHGKVLVGEILANYTGKSY